MYIFVYFYTHTTIQVCIAYTCVQKRSHPYTPKRSRRLQMRRKRSPGHLRAASAVQSPPEPDPLSFFREGRGRRSDLPPRFSAPPKVFGEARRGPGGRKRAHAALIPHLGPCLKPPQSPRPSLSLCLSLPLSHLFPRPCLCQMVDNMPAVLPTAAPLLRATRLVNTTIATNTEEACKKLGSRSPTEQRRIIKQGKVAINEHDLDRPDDTK